MKTINLLVFAAATFIFPACHSYKRMSPRDVTSAFHLPELVPVDTFTTKTPSKKYAYIKVRHDVTVKRYFRYMDSVVTAIDTARRYKINEYILVHSNPWILDSLKSTDYYVRKTKGKVQRDQTAEVILHKGDSLVVPDSAISAAISARLLSTVIDLNIPEFRLRLIQLADTILTCRVRVGRNAIQYLELAKREVNLRTPIGSGKIVRVAREPYQIDPETGKRYLGTHRDDGFFTEMPIIPWLEPEINGIRYGDLIHPTTNPQTLGKAISHGCVGTSESDAWTIYYNCPIGTGVKFRYDLRIIDAVGDTVRLKDIYKAKPRRLDEPGPTSVATDKSHFSSCF